MTNLQSGKTDSVLQNEKIMQYIDLVVEHRKKILSATLTGFLIAIVIAILSPNIFSAKVLILPPQQDQSLMSMMLSQVGGGMASVASDLVGGGSQSDMYVTILKSEAVKDAIIDRFDLMKVYGKKYRVATYGELDNWVTVTSGKKDGIIEINVEDKDPKRAAEIANAYVTELQNVMIHVNSSSAGDNRKFIAERLATAKSNLARAEDEIKRFQSANKTIDVTEQAKGTIKAIADLTALLVEQEVNLDTLRRQYTDANQQVKSAKTAISSIKAQIAKFESKGDSGVIRSVGSIPDIGQQYIRLMRDLKIQETLVELLTKQFEMSSLTESKNTFSLQVIQKARVPDRKIKPKRAIIVVAGTLASFMMSIFVTLIYGSYKTLPAEQRQSLAEIKRLFSWKRA